MLATLSFASSVLMEVNQRLIVWRKALYRADPFFRTIGIAGWGYPRRSQETLVFLFMKPGKRPVQPTDLIGAS